MNLLRNQWDRIAQQLGALSATQRLVVGLLMAVLVLTLLYSWQYLGRAEMSPVLDVGVSEAEKARIVSTLKAQGLAVEVGADGRVMVPTDRQYQAIALLGVSKALPNDITQAMDKLSASENLFDTPSKSEDRKRQMRELQLMRVLSEFPGVATARVLLDTGGQRGLMGMREPTASVMITTTHAASSGGGGGGGAGGGGGGGRDLANSVADLVRSAVSGLKRSSITVAVDGRSYQMRENDDSLGMGTGSGGDFDEIKTFHESRLARKVQDQLRFFGDVLVTVSVNVNRKMVSEISDEVDAKKTVQKEKETTSKTTESTSPTPPAEPGAVPNTGTQVGSSGGNGGSSTTSEETTKFEIIPSTKKTETRSPPGEATPTAASVRVPESYFIAAWKKQNPTATNEPAPVDIQPLLDAEIPRIKGDVIAATGLVDDKFISVQLYSDAVLIAPAAAASGGGIMLGLPLLTSHGKELAVGALALVGLFMMANVAKRSAPVPAVATAAAATVMNQSDAAMPTGPRSSRDFISGGEAMAGQVGEDADALSAVELDPEEVKVEQMQSQVADMVTANPDAATTLVTRWLDRD